jgi:uncharacterized protein YdiU (UPF0061 family)
MKQSSDVRVDSAVPILELGGDFYDEVEPARFPKEILRFRNQRWAERIGLGDLSDAQWRIHFAQMTPLPNNLKKPLALRYHGHQFGVYNPQLGDGRGFLFAQVREIQQPPSSAGQRGRLLDLGTKGSGQTPYSRSGDGKLTLKGAVREALATEMLEALGVSTSKTLSIFETGESLVRGDEPSPTRSAVLVRLSHSHIRFGTFQRLAYRRESDNIKRLIEYCCRNYFPDLNPNPKNFFECVVRATADLCASWMMAGFVHGVLNTDNMSITGESFDYGPYRFLPHYDPMFTAAYFDHSRMYAYGRQPEVVLWNLEQLALSLSSVVEIDALREILNDFAPRFNAAATAEFVNRLGVVAKGGSSDDDLMLAGFQLMNASQVMFEQFFFDWYGHREPTVDVLRAYDIVPQEFSAFRKILARYTVAPAARARLSDVYFQNSAPCSLLIDEFEKIWNAIATRDDWTPFERKISQVRERGRLFG